MAHARRIAGYLMRATGDAEVAADLTAETFAAALLARDRYRSEMGTPATWLYAIAARVEGLAASRVRGEPRAAPAADREAGAGRRRRGGVRPAGGRGDRGRSPRGAARRPADGAARPRAGRAGIRGDRGGRGRFRGRHQTAREPRAGQPAAADWRQAMSDFFGALQLELRAAGQRSPRRRIGLGEVAGALAATALLAAALLVALTVLARGDASEPPVAGGPKPAPVGTVIPRGEGTPPRERRSTVVATGTARGIGPWQLEATRSTRLADPDSGELYQPEGLRCLSFYPLDPPNDRSSQPAASAASSRGRPASGACSSARTQSSSTAACQGAPRRYGSWFPAGARSAHGCTWVRRAAAATSMPSPSSRRSPERGSTGSVRTGSLEAAGSP